MKTKLFKFLLRNVMRRRNGRCDACEDTAKLMLEAFSKNQSFTISFNPLINASGCTESWHLCWGVISTSINPKIKL